MSDYGFKISRDGKSVASTDVRDYVSHSGYKNLKTFDPISDTTAPINSVKTIPHNLEYEPMYFFFIESFSGVWYNATSVSSFKPSGWTTNFVGTFSSSDNTNLYFRVDCPTPEGAATFNIKYYIVIDPK